MDRIYSIEIAIVAIPLIYFSICFLFSRMGWYAFSSKLSMHCPPDGVKFREVSGWFNPIAAYRKNLSITISHEGVYCEQGFIFRPWHPPFFIPWEFLDQVHIRSILGWPQAIFVFRLGNNSFSIRLPENAINEAEKCIVNESVKRKFQQNLGN